MALEDYIREKREDRDILLMTHIVLGYPSMEDSLKMIEVMVRAGVDVMELQIPFSEPIADGPTILQANQRALEKGVSVQACMDLAQRAAEDFDIPFLIMTYYNILFAYGIGPFAAAMERGNLQGGSSSGRGPRIPQGHGGTPPCPCLYFLPKDPIQPNAVHCLPFPGICLLCCPQGCHGNTNKLFRRPGGLSKTVPKGDPPSPGSGVRRAD